MARAPRGWLAVRYQVSRLHDAFEEFLFCAFQSDKRPPIDGPPQPRGQWLTPPPSIRHLLPRIGAQVGGAFGSGTTGASSGSGSGSGSTNDGSGIGSSAVGGSPLSPASLAAAYRSAMHVYATPLTQHMYLTGPAMCPSLNRRGAVDPAARERLVVRVLRRPGSGNVSVGDVVAFHSPLAPPDDDLHVMVRRVAAVEGDEMVSPSEAEPSFLIPPGHCWVLADNGSLKADEVIDSRSYGHIPYENVIGRVVYAAASREEHYPVRNSPFAEDEDAAVVAAEVDVDAMFDEEEGGGSDEGAHVVNEPEPDEGVVGEEAAKDKEAAGVKEGGTKETDAKAAHGAAGRRAEKEKAGELGAKEGKDERGKGGER